jgi:hypothetical protein
LAIGRKIRVAYSRFSGRFPLKTYNRLSVKQVPEKPHWRVFAGHYMGAENGVFLQTGQKFQPDLLPIRSICNLREFWISGAKPQFTEIPCSLNPTGGADLIHSTGKCRVNIT